MSGSNNPETFSAGPTKPPALSGFAHISRNWDRTHNVFAAKILPGEYYVTIHDEAIVTVLGSCVAACIRDSKLGIGGMNHFMLPTPFGEPENDITNTAARYGNVAMEHLINQILKNGGRRENLEVKIFGGGRILTTMTDIGHRNIEFVQHYLRTEGIRLVAEDVGGVHPRKIVYFPAIGKVLVKKLRSLHEDQVVEREEKYLERLRQQPLQGDIELFD